MEKKLTPGIKISITRSISKAFENYMKSIEWDEERLDIRAFVEEWKEYTTHHASWYQKVDEETKQDPAFHKELADKINQTIDRILSEEPDEEQMEIIKLLEEEAGTNHTYSCLAEAKYVIDKLNEELKKK